MPNERWKIQSYLIILERRWKGYFDRRFKSLSWILQKIIIIKKWIDEISHKTINNGIEYWEIRQIKYLKKMERNFYKPLWEFISNDKICKKIICWYRILYKFYNDGKIWWGTQTKQRNNE